MKAHSTSSGVGTRTSPQPIRVAIFEATRMGCELLSRALESSEFGITVVPPADWSNHGGESEKIDADVAIISSSLRDGPEAGFSLLKRLSQANPLLCCVMLLDSGDKDLIIKAFRSGALGVVERDHSYELLCKCVYSVYRGQVWANSQQLKYLLEALVTGIPGKLTDAQGNVLLSTREEQIVSLVAEGMKNREIAELLGLSEHTVKNHLFRIFERLGISSRAELILYLFSHKHQVETASEPIAS